LGEAAKLLGVSVRTLRYWEEKGFLTAVKTPGGTRMYRQADLLGFDKFNLTSEKIDTAHENSVDSNFSQPKVGQTKDLTDEKLPNKNFNNLEARDIVSSTNPNRQWEDTFVIGKPCPESETPHTTDREGNPARRGPGCAVLRPKLTC
jgi:excisionase family DNA binding protein